MRIVTVLGARPQFVKAAVLSSAIRGRSSAGADLQESIIHTGQHYDPEMSQAFFDELNIPAPRFNLHVGSGSHGEMTAQMLAGIENILLRERPEVVLVYGDTNSTLAGALAAVKLHIPVAHVEAGLRSFNLRMPEEVNRVLTDRIAEILFCPTEAAVLNLRNEGRSTGVFLVGDIMYDAALMYGNLANRRSSIMERLQLEPRQFFLATIHRAENTDDPNRFDAILSALETLAQGDYPVVWPVHPRTRPLIQARGWPSTLSGLRLIDPLPYLDMVRLEKTARVILTDSGGVQKEAYFHGVPCVTLRDETEWVETVAHGWNQVVGTDPAAILHAVANAKTGTPIADYGDGHAADAILDRLLEFHHAAG
jgi:UDP-GlcNAc3NAcA epimerase